ASTATGRPQPAGASSGPESARWCSGTHIRWRDTPADRSHGPRQQTHAVSQLTARGSSRRYTAAVLGTLQRGVVRGCRDGALACFPEPPAARSGLGLLAGCGRLPWQAQEPVRAPRIGFLSPGSAEATSHVVESFRQGLREHGYVEGQTIDIEWRFLAGRNEQLASVAAELVAIPVDLIVAGSVPAVRAARDATSTIPIVMSASSDPVGAGLIASLARPGRNVTGVTSQGRELTTKRLE